MKKMLKVLALLLSVLTAFGFMMAFAENVEETPAATVALIETPAPSAEASVASEAAQTAEETQIAEATQTAEAPAAEQETPAPSEQAEATAEPTPDQSAEATAEPTPEQSAEPTVEPTEGANEEPTEVSDISDDIGVEIANIIDSEYADRSIRIYAKWDQSKALEFGDKIVLTAVLSGYDGLAYEICWQAAESASASAEWKDIDGEKDSTFTITIDEENYTNYYRATANITGLAD